MNSTEQFVYQERTLMDCIQRHRRQDHDHEIFVGVVTEDETYITRAYKRLGWAYKWAEKKMSTGAKMAAVREDWGLWVWNDGDGWVAS